MTFEEKYRLAVEVWNSTFDKKQVAEAVGWSLKTIGTRMCRLRDLGYNAKLKPSAVNSLFSHCIKQPNGCWEWNLNIREDGYGGVVARDGKKSLAHREAWKITHGEIPSKMEICHRCDNRKCINPDHLFMGTHTDNMRDMRQKERHKPHIGSKHGMAILDESKVQAIRQEYRTGNFTLQQLADINGVTIHAIWRVVHRKNWKHIA